MLEIACPACRFKLKPLETSAFLAGIALFLFATGTPALAIPSPELVVGSFTSISQLVALLSAMLGGGAALAGLRAKTRRDQRSGRAIWPITVVAIALFAVSLAANLYQFWPARPDLQQRLEATLIRPPPTADGRTLDHAEGSLLCRAVRLAPRHLHASD